MEGEPKLGQLIQIEVDNNEGLQVKPVRYPIKTLFRHIWASNFL